MTTFLENPNLPSGNVASVLVDYRINPQAERALNTLGIKVYKTIKNNNLYDAVAGHADMSIFHLSGNRFISAPEMAQYYTKIPGIDVICGHATVTNKYPGDIAYNAAKVGKWLIHNFKYTDKLVAESSVNHINVSQGYSKCSVGIVNENAIITSEVGIIRAAKAKGLDTLLINDSKIKLPGVSHGFFGGSSGLIAPDILAVNGNINSHPDCKVITDFCKKCGVSIISLHDGDIEDIGSIIPLTEIL